ncbi:uridine kinase [Marinomonas mediterranea]|uniref:uridine kinase n=1 Tax=Marinomonas mediterranea TaxID=119864 RepID=UPI002349F51B|nr:uridine kinase [Marinomonas mediterranea]WCN12045.1 uridine kinase [Marinomonas mediterranea]
MRFSSILYCALVMFGAFASLPSFSATEDAQEAETEDVAPPLQTKAELFGLEVNDLSQSAFEAHLQKMGLQPYPSYRDGVATYSLGPEGILGIRELTVLFNQYKYIKKATLSGVVESPKKRASLGKLLEGKYGPPSVGFVRDGYGRAKWFFNDGTVIELHNTTFDVSVSYVDEVPKIQSESGKIDVESLLRK